MTESEYGVVILDECSLLPGGIRFTLEVALDLAALGHRAWDCALAPSLPWRLRRFSEVPEDLPEALISVVSGDLEYSIRPLSEFDAPPLPGEPSSLYVATLISSTSANMGTARFWVTRQDLERDGISIHVGWPELKIPMGREKIQSAELAGLDDPSNR